MYNALLFGPAHWSVFDSYPHNTTPHAYDISSGYPGTVIFLFYINGKFTSHLAKYEPLYPVVCFGFPFIFLN
jgi:hypothetical protein